MVLFQFLFVPEPSIFFPSCTIAHGFAGRKVRMRIISDSYTFTANFSVPTRLVVTEGVATSVSPGISIPYQAPRFYLNANQYVPGDFNGQVILASDVDGNSTGNRLYGYNIPTPIVHEVTLVGPFLTVQWTGYFPIGGDRVNDISNRVTIVDIEPIN